MSYKRYRPVDATFYVSSPFGPRWGTQHRGVDFGKTGGSGGQPVYAAQSGKVVYAGAASGFGGRADGRAGWIVVDHPAADGAGTTVYGHVVRDAGITVGTRVVAGQRIGIINPDKTTNGGVDPHLHFEVHPYVWKAGSQIDPAVWLADARDPTIPTPSTSTSSIRKPAAAAVTTTPTAAVTATATTEKESTTVATADDVAAELTTANPRALLYNQRDKDDARAPFPTKPAGWWTANIKEMVTEAVYQLTAYERPTPLGEPGAAATERRHALGWILWLVSAVDDIRKDVKAIRAKLEAER